ncbi:MAG: pentapeptide repeat-containing protein [Crocosphaera sp.]
MALGYSIAFYISQQAINGNGAYSVIFDLAIIFTTINGTSFKNADLTDADFTNALLIFVDFRSQKLIRTCWKNAKKLEYAKVDNTILSHPEIRELLVTRNGHGKSFEKANLRGADLTEVDLSYANLKQADLSQAVLEEANLEGANLTETNCVGSNFTKAKLTAACLEAWNIDSMTILKKVNCDFVFLLEEPDPKTGSRKRFPYDTNAVFRPGDIEKFYSQLINTVEILQRITGNPEVLDQVVQELMGKHPEIDHDSIQSIEKKGEDVLNKRPVTEEKAEVEPDLREQLHEAEIEALRQVLKSELRHNQDFMQIIINAILKQSPSPTIKIQQKTNTMSKKQKIQTGDVKGNLIGNVGGNFDASGAVFNIDNVSNSINELPPSSDPEKPGIKELLDQLKTAISESSDLNDADKAQALEQVNTLAEAGQNPKDSNMQQQAKGALRFLKGLMTELPTVTQLVEQCQEWFPTISKFFGL